ncbi:uncharacterized protein EI90DRAFT_791062 [Cantharellus anzutake]|uniref:uncharacterized protein n=1 Tax=Cantharellus anzutake TaxID=1750568 RepID=UPI001908353A|nr:uncharacterized protein EI90DRAFT_791062 [Cantharellus anzutake]KAF8342806.1 hypothetical protein EI90DRAFT_791062 [Cantharellus anzutake]
MLYSNARVCVVSIWYLLALPPMIGALNPTGALQLQGPPLSFGDRLGLIFIAQASACSCIAVTCLLSYFAFNSIQSRRLARSTRPKLISTHVDVYFLNVLLFDLVHSIGGIMNVRWALSAEINRGSFCHFQGILKNIGALGVAMFILAITIHTAAVMLWRWKAPRKATAAIVLMLTIWLFITLEIGLSLALYHRRQYIDISGMWCWIGPHFKNQRLLFEYVWIWITAIFNLLMYIPLYFSLRGNLHVNGFRVKWTSQSSADTGLVYARTSYARAGSMLWYPVAYTVIVLPFSVCRWRAFNRYHVSWTATVLADVLFCSSGLVNSLLYPLTRPSLLPAGRHNRHSMSSPPYGPSIQRNSTPLNYLPKGPTLMPPDSPNPVDGGHIEVSVLPDFLALSPQSDIAPSLESWPSSPCSRGRSSQSLLDEALGTTDTFSEGRDGYEATWGGTETGLSSSRAKTCQRGIRVSSSPPDPQMSHPLSVVGLPRTPTFPTPAAAANWNAHHHPIFRALHVPSHPRNLQSRAMPHSTHPSHESSSTSPPSSQPSPRSRWRSQGSWLNMEP